MTETDVTETEWMKACNRSACVEISEIGIRDSKNPDAPIVASTPEKIATLIKAAKSGVFDHLLTGEV